MTKSSIIFKKIVDSKINNLSDDDFKSISNISKSMHNKSNLLSEFNSKKNYFSSKSNYLYLLYFEGNLVGYLKGVSKHKSFYIDWIYILKDKRNNLLGTKLQIRVFADLKKNGFKKIISERHNLDLKNIKERIVNRKGNQHYFLKTTLPKKNSYTHRFKSIIRIKK